MSTNPLDQARDADTPPKPGTLDDDIAPLQERGDEVGKTVDEWVIIADEGQELHTGMVGERVDSGDTSTFVARPDGTCEIVLVGPADARGHRRIGLHRSKV